MEEHLDNSQLINEHQLHQLPSTLTYILFRLPSIIRIVMQSVYICLGIYIFIKEYINKCDLILEYIPLIIVINSILQIYTLIYDDFISRPNELLSKLNSFFRIIIQTLLLFLFIYLIFYSPLPDECEGLDNSYRFLWGYFIFEYILLFIIIVILSGIIMCGARIFYPSIFISALQAVPFRTGASDSALEQLSVYKYKVNGTNLHLINKDDGEDIIIINADSTTCIICMEIYENDCNIRYLGCTHHYHVNCCDAWLKINKSCPLCRAPVEI